jgi:hypothetical protein
MHLLQFKALPASRLDVLVIVIENCTVLISKCLATFLMSDKQQENYRKITLDNGKEYVMLEAKGKGFKIFHMERVLTPSKKFYPKLIKVNLQEMVQYVRCVSLSQELHMFAINKSNLSPGSLFYTVVEKREYFPICFTWLDKLSITLVDENNKQLKVGGGGHATFVKLHFRKKEINCNMETFPPLRLSSRQSIDVYPENQANNFKIQLHDVLLPSSNLSEHSHMTDWEVALTSIYVPTKIDYEQIVRETDGIWIDIKLGGDINTAARRVVFDLPKDTLSCREFVTKANKELKATETAKVWGEDQAPFKFYEKTRGELYVEFNAPVRLRVSGLFCYLLGKANSMQAAPMVRQEIKGVQHFGHLDFHRLHPNLLFIHCDFVGITAVGNSWSNVLQMINVPVGVATAATRRANGREIEGEGEGGRNPPPASNVEAGQGNPPEVAGETKREEEGATAVAVVVEKKKSVWEEGGGMEEEEEDEPIEFLLHRPRQDFVPVTQTDRNALQFELRNADGKLIHFAEEKAEVLVTLEFRKRKNYEQMTRCQ